jgi:hypothetical protein
VLQRVVGPTDRFAVALSLGDIDEAFLSDTGVPVINKGILSDRAV